MNVFAAVLRFSAPIFLAVGALHLVLGVNADVLLGAKLPVEALHDPVLDSQNRFYGVAFTLYGVLLWVCAGDLLRYRVILRCVLWTFFAAGCARLVAIAITGVPGILVMGLLASELVLPPLLLRWQTRVERMGST